jgi:hypothetical protein
VIGDGTGAGFGDREGPCDVAKQRAVTRLWGMTRQSISLGRVYRRCEGYRSSFIACVMTRSFASVRLWTWNIHEGELDEEQHRNVSIR